MPWLFGRGRCRRSHLSGRETEILRIIDRTDQIAQLRDQSLSDCIARLSLTIAVL
jgi:hypothetical protein